ADCSTRHEYGSRQTDTDGCRIANQNPNGNGNVVAPWAEGNAIKTNGNQISYYNCRGFGHLVRNCTIRPRRRDVAYLQTQLLIAQKEEAGIQIQAEEFDLMAAVADLDKIEEVNANYILTANLQQASTSGTQTNKAPVYDSNGSTEIHNYNNCYDNEIFNMFTQEEQYTKLLEPIPEPHQVQQNDSNVISDVSSVQLERGTLDQHPATVEETRAYFESLYNNLAIEVEKVNSLSKEKSTVSSLLEEKIRLKSDFKLRENELLDKQIQLENKIKELDNILVKTGQSIQTMHMLSPKPDSFYQIEHKMALGYQNLFYLKQAQQKQQSLYNGKVLLEKHDPPVVYDSEETLQLAQERFILFSLLGKKSVSKQVKANVRTNPITISQPHVITKKGGNSNFNGLSSIGVDNTVKTRRPHPKSNTKNDRVPSASKSSCFLGTVRFGNDHVAVILAFSDLQWGNILITMVYFIEGLGHNLFSVWQFCDSNLEVAFRRNTCFVKNLEEVDLLKGNRTTNLYTVNLHEMASASPIYLMAHATSTKSWLCHQRLSHLNFDTINDLAKNDLVTGLLKFKYHKEHICPSLRIASINGKRYVLVIVDGYSRYTWVHFLRSKDEAPKVIKTFLKRITILLQSPVIIIRIDNGTEFKNQILKEYFDSVGISHQASSVRTPQQNRAVEEKIERNGYQQRDIKQAKLDKTEHGMEKSKSKSTKKSTKSKVKDETETKEILNGPTHTHLMCMSTRSSTRNLFLPLDNTKLTIQRRTHVDPNLLNDFNMSTNRNVDDIPPAGGGDLPVPDLQTREELCQPTLNGRGGLIALIAIQATNFGLKNDMIQQVQNSCQFHGLSGDDANKHLDKFLHVTQSIKVNGVTDDALRLYLFPHSLTHHATTWFDHFPRNSITTFKKMAKMFLKKYFPPSMMTKLRNEITNFRQLPNESLFEAWEHYNLLIDCCPNHNMLPVTKIDTFYNGLTLRHRDTINAAASETFMKRRPKECYDRIENMTAYHNDWDTFVQRSESSSSITSSFDLKIVALKAEMAKISKNLMKVLQINQQNVYAAGAYNQGESKPKQSKSKWDSRKQSWKSSEEQPRKKPILPRSQSWLKPASSLSSTDLSSPGLPSSGSSSLDSLTLKLKYQIRSPLLLPLLSQLKLPSFMDALILMPKFGPTIKSLLTNKDKLFELARTPLNEHCSAVLLKKSPEKLGEPGKFLISCDFSGMDECLALSDLGASINLMPLSVWKKISHLNYLLRTCMEKDFSPELSPTCMTLEHADRSISCLVGVIDDVFVKTGHALIDVYKGELTLRVGNKAVTFNLDQNSRYSSNYDDMSVNQIDIIDVACEGDFLLEETDAFLAIEDEPISPKIDDSYYDSDGDILLLEEYLNDDPSSPPLPL
nr:reverse transcriptase domain-containing protein [Tanacetum cinerariifolium]